MQFNNMQLDETRHLKRKLDDTYHNDDKSSKLHKKDNHYGDNDGSDDSDDSDDDGNDHSNKMKAITYLKDLDRKFPNHNSNFFIDKIDKKINHLSKDKQNKDFISVLEDIISEIYIFSEEEKNFKFNKFIKKYEKNMNVDQKKNNDPEQPQISLPWLPFDNSNFTFLMPFPVANVNVVNNKNNNMSKGEREKNDKLIKEFTELNNIDGNGVTTERYFRDLGIKEKEMYLEKLKSVKMQDSVDKTKKPNMMKVLEWDTCDSNKAVIISKLNTFENLRGSSEFFKLRNWITKIMKVPFGKYIKPVITKDHSQQEIITYLNKVRKDLDTGIYGHDVTKDQLLKILAQTITNPKEGGNIFALQGPPGVGKTALISGGIAKALGKPFSFISLGGATDACFLEGHDYTYEGSNHGRIVEVLQQTGCMNPIIYFDELDKVSDTPKGEEIINILMHITDMTQNSHFNDKYFGGINFDLSKAIIIFSFNEEHKVSRILRDRMKIIRVKGYKLVDKINIARDYLLPTCKKDIGIVFDATFSNEILEFMIDNYTNEGGVRKLKELINDILLELNLRYLEGKINNQIEITKELLENDILRKKKHVKNLTINSESKVGVVNGLWANDLGMGGLIPIECCWVPANKKMDLKLTGMQGKVMKESMDVARTVAWRILPDELKKTIMRRWEKSVDYGIHIHCPDGATPKDGPSAGGAITSCLISLLTNTPVNNKIAMTGEINLKGQITAIGGLEEKVFGAIKAGAELVLYPKENDNDMKDIIEKFPTLINDKFKVKMVENIWNILDNVLVNNTIDFIKF